MTMQSHYHQPIATSYPPQFTLARLAVPSSQVPPSLIQHPGAQQQQAAFLLRQSPEFSCDTSQQPSTPPSDPTPTMMSVYPPCAALSCEQSSAGTSLPPMLDMELTSADGNKGIRFYAFAAPVAATAPAYGLLCNPLPAMNLYQKPSGMPAESSPEKTAIKQGSFSRTFKDAMKPRDDRELTSVAQILSNLSGPVRQSSTSRKEVKGSRAAEPFLGLPPAISPLLAKTLNYHIPPPIPVPVYPPRPKSQRNPLAVPHRVATGMAFPIGLANCAGPFASGMATGMGNGLFHPRSILPAAVPLGLKVKSDLSKKHIKTRRKTTSAEKQALMKIFEEENNLYPNKELREKLGQQLGMTPRQVQVWFQNQRSKLAKRSRGGTQAQPSSDGSDGASPAQSTTVSATPDLLSPKEDTTPVPPAAPSAMQIEEESNAEPQTVASS